MEKQEQQIDPKKNPKKKRNWKLWGGIIAAVVIVAAASQAGGGDDRSTANTASDESKSVEKSAIDDTEKKSGNTNKKEVKKAESKKDAKKQEPEDSRQKWADKIYKAWLTTVGIKQPLDLLEIEERVGDDVLWAVNGHESPSEGTLVLTIQLRGDDVENEELTRSAEKVMNLAGYDNKDLKRVEVVTADLAKRGAFNRHDSLLLNR